jgi:hypothetical protein
VGAGATSNLVSGPKLVGTFLTLFLIIFLSAWTAFPAIAFNKKPATAWAIAGSLKSVPGSAGSSHDCAAASGAVPHGLLAGDLQLAQTAFNVRSHF